MNTYLRITSLAILLALLLTACSSGSDDPEVPTPTPVTPTPTASLTFSVTANDGMGTAAQPFTATPGQSLNATLSQTVTYTDDSGQQQTVSPKATIAATVETDTIRAADLAALTKLTEQNPKTSTEGSNPKTATRQQTFDIGGQQITFDLSHEIYSYTTASGQQTELPYVELKAPKYGAATPDTVSSTRSAQGFGQMPVASVTAIRLTPLGSQTRSTTVRDTTIYDVAVSFTIDAATHNTASDATQTLSADIHYTALVENVTEVPCASTSLSYELTARKGTSDAQSPFGFTSAEPLVLEWTEDAYCSYIAASDLSTHAVSLQPKASVTVSVASDTIHYAGYKDSVCVATIVPPVVFTEGQQPQQTVGTQTFRIASQTVTVSWSYDDYGSILVEDSTVAMPYLQVEAPELVEVTLAETAQARQAMSRLTGRTYTIAEGQTRADASSDVSNFQGGVALYEVTARFRQSLKGVNTPSEVAETVEYIVKYIAAVEAKLISTTYEKDYEWTAAHDNMPWLSYYKVHRTRTYSTGEKEVDTFVHRYGYMVSLERLMYAWGKGGYGDSEFTLWNDGQKVVYHKENYSYDDFTLICSYKTGSPDLNLHGETGKDLNQWEKRGDLSSYESDIFGHEGKPLQYNPENPIESWYDRGIYRVKLVRLFYADGLWLRGYEIVIEFYDRILYLDGQLFEFSEYRPTYDFDFREENTTLSDGTPAKVFTHECKAKYLGKDFYVALVDTVYQLPASEARPAAE